MTGAGLDAGRRVPFGDIAAEWGYVRDPAAPARASPVLRAPGLPKPVTTRRGNGHWVHFSTLDPDDSGTAVDSMLRRGLSLSDIRARHQSPDAAPRDFRGVWNGATPDPAPEWLAGRGVRRETLDACRPLVRRDGGGRVPFAHRDRNRALTGSGIGPPDGPGRFATGGTRGLFAVRAGTAAGLKAPVVTEGSVDALSLARIDGCPADHAFLSTASTPSGRQCGQIGLAARALPNVRAVVLAQDGDAAGDRQAETLRGRLQLPPHVTLVRRQPPDGQDRNDVVRAVTKG